MGAAGSSLASSARDLALAEKTRPAGCPKDPLVFKPSNASPRLAGVVPVAKRSLRIVQYLIEHLLSALTISKKVNVA
jgi:hypothetical protein